MPLTLVFGASIAYGAWDTQGGWVQRLRSYTDQKALDDPPYYSRLFNLSVSGDTSTDLLQHMDQEIQPRISKEAKRLFLISIGVNDSGYIRATKENVVPLEQFEQNIQKIINLAKQYCRDIVFVGISPVDESKVDPTPWRIEWSYLNEHIKMYNKTIESLCKKNNVNFIDVLSVLEKLSLDSILADGIHPNNAGHKKIFEIVKKSLEKNRLI